MIHPDEWRVHIVHEPQMDLDRLVIFTRWPPNVVRVITGWNDEGFPISQTFETPQDTYFDPPKLYLPYGVVQAIANHVKPGPASEEVKRLEEALDKERQRVDNLLMRAFK